MARINNTPKSSLKMALNNEQPAPASLADQLSQPAPAPEPEPKRTAAKEQIEDRKKLEKSLSPAQKPAVEMATPEKAVDAIGQVAKAPLVKEAAGRSEQIRQRLDEILDEQKAAAEDFKKTKDKLAWQETAETIGRALAQLGTGAYGMKHGVDLSGVQFRPSDWNRKMDQAMSELKERRLTGQQEAQRLATEQERIAAREEREEERGPAEKRAERRLQMEEERLELSKQRAEQDKKKLEGAGTILTPVQKKISEERAKQVAKEVSEWEAGGRKKALSKIRGGEEALKLLKQKDTILAVSGTFGRGTSNVAGAILNMLGEEKTGKGLQKGAEVQRLINEMQQANIGEVLDSQFAAREADQVLKRAFDPLAPRETQLKTVSYMLEVLKDTHKEKEALVDHLNKGGTRETFVSPMKTKYEKKAKERTGESLQKKPEQSLEQKRKRLEELRKKLRGE